MTPFPFRSGCQTRLDAEWLSIVTTVGIPLDEAERVALAQLQIMMIGDHDT
jgi:hypothetical protein